MIKVILAHGALGPFDELVYLVPEIVFFTMMVRGWLRSRRALHDAGATAEAESSDT